MASNYEVPLTVPKLTPLHFFTAFISFFFLLGGQGYAQFPAGSGEPTDPYQISTIQQLQEVKNYPDKYFIQVGHIDGTVTAFWNDSLGFEPIGTENNPFSGHYDGKGYEIRNLHINRSEEENVGLFGFKK